MIPTADQLGQARLAQWHQNGEALLTFENLRSWINVAGLVLFAPRPQQLPAPSPSFVEAILGATNAEPTLADLEQARSLLTRMIAEGIVVPLNLLGTPGDTPDFVVSAPVFSYIFTLRGDKAWKQPPVTMGAVKVSPLAAATHEILSKRPMMTAYDLATELGKEVTETAVVRALNELWSHLRVLPVGQPDGGATLWELAGTRFTKQIKAGANAGQPSALSALISLYLGTAMLASEEEIEIFLSPLAPRSRIRDVVHALMGARELETLAVDGRTLLHVSGSLPSFIAPAVETDVETERVEATEAIEAEPAGTLEPTDAPRIAKFVAKPRKVGTGFPSDYGRKFNGTPMDDRDRRPFNRTEDRGANRGFDRSARPQRDARPSFDKPWSEDRAARSQAPGKPRFDRDTRSDNRSGSDRPNRPENRFERRDGSRPAFGRKPGFGDNREGFATRPPRREFTPRTDESGRPPRREFTPRTDNAGRPPRREFTPRSDNAGRPPRREFTPRNDNAGRPPRREFTPRNDNAGRPPRREFTPRNENGTDAPRRSFPKPGGFGGKREGFGGKPGGFAPRPGGFSRDRGDREGQDAGRPAFRKFDAPRGPRPSGDRPARPWTDRSDRPERSERSDRGDRGDRPARPFNNPAGGGFGAKKPFTKFGDKPGKSFGKAPFAGKSGFKGKPAAGGFKGKSFDKPFQKRRPEGGA
jgi:23S rRNA pseudouridine2605 synthase